MAKQRSEVDARFKWAVNDIFSSDEAWEAEYVRCDSLFGKPCPYEGKIGGSAENLAAVLQAETDESYDCERLYVYAFMKYYEDTANPTYQAMSGKAQMIAMKLSEKYAFAEPEILEIDENTMKTYMEADCVAFFKKLLDDMLSKRVHSLSAAEEKLLAMSDQMSNAASEIFSKFNNADVKFGEISDENGEKKELTHGTFAVFMESSDREVRKEAFYALYKQYKSHINTLASTYYANVCQAMFYARARKYPSTLNMYLSASFIPDSVYTNLIETVNKNLPKMHKYVSLRKRCIGVDELHFYDIYAPMVKDFKMEVTYNQAKEIALKALAPLGEDYLAKVQEGFDTGWVDVYENVGKRSGAFSWGVYGTHPYVFLNYTNTLNDVFTLVHEMGHAMHTYYSNETQPFVYSEYKIFVAEVASTCNETLLINYLLGNCTDENERKYLINHYLEQFKGTLFRQTMFAEFEMESHKMAEAGEVLNAQNLCALYSDLNKKYFGSEMVIDEEISYEWARIPHFYNPFYVYQYATGFSAAIAIATKILAGDKEVISGYRKFLSGGSSMHPIDLLKLCGVDMSKPQVIQEALDVFDGLLAEF
jgi:oligoendopeptidase F